MNLPVTTVNIQDVLIAEDSLPKLSITMNKYSKCPHCGRTSTGLDVYECKNCGRIMCYYDGTFGFGSTGCSSASRCPDCRKMRSEAPIVKIGDVVS